MPIQTQLHCFLLLRNRKQKANKITNILTKRLKKAAKK